MEGQETLADNRTASLYAAGMDTAKWVKAARKHKGMTQEQLGDHLSVTKANVSHWEGGKHEPGINQLIAIRDVTGYPLLDNDVATPPENIRQALRLLGSVIAGSPDERTAAIAEGLAGLARDRGAEFRQKAVLALLEADQAPDAAPIPPNVAGALTSWRGPPREPAPGDGSPEPTQPPRQRRGKRGATSGPPKPQ